jgi:hypothetical protein
MTDGIDDLIRTTAVPQCFLETAKYEYLKTKKERLIFKKDNKLYYFKKVPNDNNYQEALRLVKTTKK